MDINRAREIVAILAEGIDPTTGEVLSDDNVCNKPEDVYDGNFSKSYFENTF